MDRTCHKSVIAALVLADVTPVFLAPLFNRETGLYVGISQEALKAALEEAPDVVGLLVTSPTYYGLCSPLADLAEVLHQRGKVLLVDEAHGAHFGFHPRLPQTALSQGADLVVQSAHKTLPALGQSSLLHLGKKSLMSETAVARALHLLQTTSPSYLLMSAMEEAVLLMEREGEGRLDRLLSAVEKGKAKVTAAGRVTFIEEKDTGRPMDGLRLVADFRRCGMSGHQAAERLQEEYGIYAEMADAHYVVMIITVSHTEEELEPLWQALLALSAEETDGKREEETDALPMPAMAMSPREGWMMPTEELPLGAAVGRVSGDIVAVCPPGAAILVPGQVLDEATISYMKKNSCADTVRVVKGQQKG